MNELLAELIKRLNGEDYQRHDKKIMFGVNYFEAMDDGAVKLILKPFENPDYDPHYWQKVEAERKAAEGATNESN